MKIVRRIRLKVASARAEAAGVGAFLLCAAACVLLSAPLAPGAGELAAQEGPDRRARIESLLTTLAHDSLEGRQAASPGARSAAGIIASELEAYGVEPGVGDSFFQIVPLVPTGSQRRPLALPDMVPGAPRDTLEAVNVIGIVRGSDPELAHEYVVVGAHFDHVGVGEPVDGDSIYNGADDDASGVVTVLEVARSLARGVPPARSVVFFLSTAEEMGLLGIRHFLAEPTIPLEQIVANLQVEMVGRPDSLAGGPGRAWLTGYERSTIGEMLARAGVPIVADPRPDQRFFMRSDNIAFALQGIPAHTISSFGLHTDYHQPSDEVDLVDFGHMARVVDATEQAVRVLAGSGPAPEWNPGGRPEMRNR